MNLISNYQNYQNTSNFNAYQPLKKQEREETKESFSAAVNDNDIENLKDEESVTSVQQTGNYVIYGKNTLSVEEYGEVWLRARHDNNEESMSVYREMTARASEKQKIDFADKIDIQRMRDFLLNQMEAILNQSNLKVEASTKETLIKAKSDFEYFWQQYDDGYNIANGLSNRLVSLDLTKETQKEDYLNTVKEIAHTVSGIGGAMNGMFKSAEVFFGAVSSKLPSTQKDSIIESMATLFVNYSALMDNFVFDNGLVLYRNNEGRGLKFYSLNNTYNVFISVKNKFYEEINNLTQPPTTPTQKIAEQTADSLVKEMLQNPKTNETKETTTSEVKV